MFRGATVAGDTVADHSRGCDRRTRRRRLKWNGFVVVAGDMVILFYIYIHIYIYIYTYIYIGIMSWDIDVFIPLCSIMSQQYIYILFISLIGGWLYLGFWLRRECCVLNFVAPRSWDWTLADQNSARHIKTWDESQLWCMDIYATGWGSQDSVQLPYFSGFIYGRYNDLVTGSYFMGSINH